MCDDQAILVTGAGCGLGLALTAKLVEAGYHIFAGLRDIADAHKLPQGAKALQLDVTNAEQIEQAANLIRQSGFFLRALINNAGVHTCGPVELESEANIHRVFDVNFFGALAVTRAFLPHLREQRGGQIYMVSSLSGLVGLPGDGVYAASKHALEALTESLSVEMAHWGVGVYLLQPGAYATNLIKHQASQPEQTPYSEMQVERERTKPLPPVEEAAEEIAHHIEHPPRNLRCPIGPQARAVSFALSGISQQDRRDLIVRAAHSENWIQEMDTGGPPNKVIRFSNS